MSNHAVNAVIAYWIVHDVKFLPGVSDEELEACEKALAVKIPADMSCFYKKTNGTRVPLSSGQDHESYDFYRLSDLAPDSRIEWAINFADYRELSWWFATDLTGLGPFGVGTVYLLGAQGGKPFAVARSFTEFLELYLRDDERLTPDGALAYHQQLLRNL